MFKQVGLLIKEIPKRRASRAIVAIQIRQSAKEAIKLVYVDLTEDIIEQIKVEMFKNGVLGISAPSLVLSELQMRSSELKDVINKDLGKTIVKNLRFRVG